MEQIDGGVIITITTITTTNSSPLPIISLSS